MSFSVFNFDDTSTMFFRFHFFIFIWEMKLNVASQSIITRIVFCSMFKYKIIVMNICLIIFSRSIRIWTTKITSIDRFFFFDRLWKIFCNLVHNDSSDHNFSIRFDYDSTISRMINWSWSFFNLDFDLVLEIILDHDFRFDYCSESFFVMR